MTVARPGARQLILCLLGGSSLTAPSLASAGIGDGATPDLGRALDPPAPSEPSPPAPPPNLFPRVPIATAAGWILAPEPEPDDREARAEAALEEYFDEQLGRDRVDAGHADGWYYEARRAMLEQFRPDRQRVEDERRAGMTTLQILYDELRRYARGPERPIDVPGQPTGSMRAAVPRTPIFAGPEAVEQERMDQQNLLNGSVTWYRVDLRITHNAEGDVAAAWVIRSSGLRSLDEAALTAARSGVIERPPPARVMGRRDAIQSDWAFEMGDVATDPLQAGCVGDLGSDQVQCAAVGRGIVRLRVYLLRVMDAMTPSPAERRAARRRDPAMPSP